MRHIGVDQKFQKALNALWRAKLYTDINLPAIIVCGDQSSGKSAVLEAISGYRFPVNDGMCTRFVTRVEMDQDSIVQLTASIIPSPHHTIQRQEELREWNYKTTDFEDFENVVLLAGEVMGSRLVSGFLKDELVIRISAPDLPAFVFIDLPGLIQSVREGQPESDIEYIESLVISYMEDTSKIILTVVAANNDLELQGVLRHARKIDPQGARTIGVITKPDACEERPAIQRSALELLRNTNNGLYQWLLGWHVLKNRSDSQRQMTTEERDAGEKVYLARPPWDQIHDSFKGAENLSTRLETHIFKKFISHLPALRIQIQEKCRDAKLELDWANPTVSSLLKLRTDLRIYLDKIENEMNELVTKASEDSKDEFGSSIEDIAADIPNLIRSNGHFYEFDEECLVEQPRQSTSDLQTQWNFSDPQPVSELQSFAEAIVADTGVDAGQISESVYQQLFQKQTTHWHDIFRQYIDKVRDLLETHFSVVASRIVPTEIEAVFNDVVISRQVERFAEQLRNQTNDLLVPGKLRGRQATEATSKAWKAQYDLVEERRLREAFGITDESGRSTGQTVRRDYQTVLQSLRRLEVNTAAFPARQAIALMQLLYISRTDDVKPTCDEKTILRVMRELFNGWAERVMSTIDDEKLKVIFDASAVEGEDIGKLKEKIALYEECLSVLHTLRACAEV